MKLSRISLLVLLLTYSCCSFTSAYRWRSDPKPAPEEGDSSAPAGEDPFVDESGSVPVEVTVEEAGEPEGIEGDDESKRKAHRQLARLPILSLFTNAGEDLSFVEKLVHFSGAPNFVNDVIDGLETAVIKINSQEKKFAAEFFNTICNRVVDLLEAIRGKIDGAFFAQKGRGAMGKVASEIYKKISALFGRVTEKVAQQC